MVTITDWIGSISNAITTLLTIGILIGAYYQIKQVKIQLKSLAENQKSSTIMTVLELESELNRRKENFDKANFELREYSISIQNTNHELNQEIVELISDKINTSKENYLNSLDRLAYCIIHKYLSDRDWRTEYRDVFFDAVDNYNDCFGISSRFRNTKQLYEKWKTE